MQKTSEQLASYRQVRKELQALLNGEDEKDHQIYENLWYLEFMEKGGIIAENGDFLTDSKKLFEQVRKRYQNNSMTAYWIKQKEWNVRAGVSGQLEERVREWLESNFFPGIDKKQIVGDLACASGQWSFLAAERAQWVYAYDCAGGMIETAQKKAGQQGIENVTFTQADAMAVRFEKQFDNFMMMGLLTYIVEEEDAIAILCKLQNALKPGGCLLVRDSLNETCNMPIYNYNFTNGYQAVYRDVKGYRELLDRCGFKIESEVRLREETSDGIRYVNYGAILKKE